MKRLLKIHVGISIALILTLALAFSGCAGKGIAPEKTSASIAVSGSGIPGKTLDVTGNGFTPGEVIELVLNMEDVPIIVGRKGKAIKAGQDGTFAAKTNYPHKYVAIPGLWDLVATGDKGSEAICKVEIKKP
jgi:hypothetical protein